MVRPSISSETTHPMFGIENTGSTLDTIAHIIQVALTPVFLLSGIATLLTVFATRLARVGDKVEAITKALDDADDEQQTALQSLLKNLHRRSVALDVAVVLGAIGGAATCAAVLAMFVGALSEEATASVLFMSTENSQDLVALPNVECGNPQGPYSVTSSLTMAILKLAAQRPPPDRAPRMPLIIRRWSFHWPPRCPLAGSRS